MKLVLMPGLDGTGELYTPLLAELPEELAPTVVSYPADRDLDLDAAADLAMQAVADDEPWMLFAESYSGLVAARILTRRPSGLRGAVFCASFLKRPLAAPAASMARLLAPLVLRKAPPRFAVRSWLTGPGSDAALVDAVRAAVGQVAPAVLTARLRRCLSADVTADFAGTETPLLYLCGNAEDRLVGKVGLEQLLAARPDAQVTNCHGAHLLAQVHPEKVARALCLFAAHLHRASEEEVPAALLEIASLRSICADFGGICEDIGVEDGRFDPVAAILGEGPFASVEAGTRERLLLGGSLKMICHLLTVHGNGAAPGAEDRAAVARVLGSGALDERPILRDALSRALDSNRAHRYDMSSLPKALGTIGRELPSGASEQRERPIGRLDRTPWVVSEDFGEPFLGSGAPERLVGRARSMSDGWWVVDLQESVGLQVGGARTPSGLRLITCDRLLVVPRFKGDKLPIRKATPVHVFPLELGEDEQTARAQAREQSTTGLRPVHGWGLARRQPGAC